MNIPDLLFESAIKEKKVHFFSQKFVTLSLYEFKLITLGFLWLGLSNIYCLEFQIQLWGNSLAAQFLRLCVLTVKGPGLNPGQGTEIPQASQCGKKISYWVAVTNSCQLLFPQADSTFPWGSLSASPSTIPSSWDMASSLPTLIQSGFYF